uniref:Uncharacterized protein n=1 Tax=Onchocerca volvulus TaxID=6282 RepID=A0A8R1XNG8_ONCVO
MGPSIVESLEETMTLIYPHRIVLSEHMWRMAILEIWTFLPAKNVRSHPIYADATHIDNKNMERRSMRRFCGAEFIVVRLNVTDTFGLSSFAYIPFLSSSWRFLESLIKDGVASSKRRRI